ncbi:MAG: TonB-dependent receptor [Prevotella sp.]|nr:TonB-dependent receptor [Candidatus Prevotella equi]
MYKRLQLFIVMTLMTIMAAAQGQVKGLVLDKNNSEALSFVSVSLSPEGSTNVVTGGTTDVSGSFHLNNIKYGKYVLKLNFMGYKPVSKNIELNAKNPHVTFAALYMTEDAQVLKEVQVTGQRATMKLEVDRKSFDVASLATLAGQTASEVLENIPSVEVDNEGNVSLRGNSSVEVWINGRASGLTADNRAQILQQLPAESIERIEVIDNPSAKFSAEGSAGIINIILKKDRKAGYYGSVQAGATTLGGANASFNINYNSSKLDAYFNIGYRHGEHKGQNISDQKNFLGNDTTYERHTTDSRNQGNTVFTRAGLTWHATDKDDFSVSGMLFTGKHKGFSSTPYYYGNMISGIENPTFTRLRNNTSGGPMTMYNVEFNYRHNFTEKNFLDFVVSHNQWSSNQKNVYQELVTYEDLLMPSEEKYQSRPLNIKNHNTEIKLDYEAQLSKLFKLQAGYNATFSRENTPQESYEAPMWDAKELIDANPEAYVQKNYYNKFKYNNDIHAFYATLSFNKDKFGIMAGLRGEYWKVYTESMDWDQAMGIKEKDAPFKKDYFQLFPSVFMTYQLTKTQQLQVNYTRRLRRPWGGQLNNFKNTSDASIVSFGNPLLTPEFSNSLALNYLKTWEKHSILVSAYYKPTSDVMQRVNYRNMAPGEDYEKMYSTTMNVARSTSTGVEVTAKNKLWKILDLTTNVNAYYYKLNDFAADIEGQLVTGKAQENFTWNARIIASVQLPYDISIQASGRYSSRQALTQGYRPSSYGLDLGVRKNFFNRMFTLAINCRDVLNSRQFETHTSGDSFERYQLNKRHSRNVSFTLTWNFGNSKGKKKRQDQQGDGEEMESMGGYDM